VVWNAIAPAVLGLLFVLGGIGSWFGKVEPRHAATASTDRQNAVIFVVAGLLFVVIGLVHLL
jgi:hypothetical protein